MSSRITPEMKYLAAECEQLMTMASQRGNYDIVTKLQKIYGMIYSGKVSNAELKKCLNGIRLGLQR